MIAIEMSIKPWVFETAGDGFSVQFTYSARKSVKSHVLVAESSCWYSVSGIRHPLL